MQITKRNHYNPCFWTAYWNPAYYEEVRRGRQPGDARSPRVFALNVKGNKVLHNSVENVHFDKGLGIAEIKPEDALDFCKRRFPEDYEEFCKLMEKCRKPFFLDFEPVLSGIEKTPAYKTLLKVIARPRNVNRMEKVDLACFVIIHQLRSHAIMNSMLEWHQELGFKRFEFFWLLKGYMNETKYLDALVRPLLSAYWTFFRTENHSFPLTDSPILAQPESVMVALSPRLLLEIDRTKRVPPAASQQTWAPSISAEKLAEFQRRTIQNSFREIIFSDASVLEKWRSSDEFQRRHEVMRGLKAYNAVVARDGEAELWKINAFGGNTATFENEKCPNLARRC